MQGKKIFIWLAAMVFSVTLFLSACSNAPATSGLASNAPVEFTDVEAQTREFIGYYQSIQLNPEQQKIKERALAPLPAACCSDNSMLKCCCPCNFAKTVWGLSNHAIANLGHGEEQVRELVLDWINFINPEGFDGQACYEGRCDTPFSVSGCGGMKSNQLVL
ncbi:MAG: hypothetical protein ACRD1R_12685 [Acidobacteriota bacterium]